MNINDLTILEIKEIAALVPCLTGSTPKDENVTPKTDVGRNVIVRSRDAGVIYGKFVSLDGQNVTLTDAIQIWKWKAVKGGTLIDCAEYGIVKSWSKVSGKSAKTIVIGACALIDVSDEAAKTFESATW